MAPFVIAGCVFAVLFVTDLMLRCEVDLPDEKDGV